MLYEPGLGTLPFERDRLASDEPNVWLPLPRTRLEGCNQYKRNKGGNMFNKKNNTSKEDSQNPGKQHPFIRKIKDKLIADKSQNYMKLIMEDLKSKNYVFSNN
jgi:hypothetical protein